MNSGGIKNFQPLGCPANSPLRVKANSLTFWPVSRRRKGGKGGKGIGRVVRAAFIHFFLQKR